MLEGELRRLEHDWHAAEEIAGIADDLSLPEPVRRLNRLRAKLRT